MKNILLLLLTSLVLISCNKEKKLMKRLTANWTVSESTITLFKDNGNDSLIDQTSNAGKLMIYDEDPENPSKDSKLYDLTIHNEVGDTVFHIIGGTLITDEKNNRMIMQKALSDSTYQSDLIWTIVKQRKNKQEWSTFGVDYMLFYPDNNNNPGAAANWIDWTIVVKRD